jgi:hypothetical protein
LSQRKRNRLHKMLLLEERELLPPKRMIKRHHLLKHLPLVNLLLEVRAAQANLQLMKAIFHCQAQALNL